MIHVHQFPCLSDNYGWLLHSPLTGETACIDTPDGEEILRQAALRGWRITHVLNTHWHPDHTGGNTLIREQTGAAIIGPEEVSRAAPQPDTIVRGGDRIGFGGFAVDVIDVSGHTLGHVAYSLPEHRLAFVGDSLFALGCGRLFEGEPAQMWASLQRLARLDPETLICCAHEYTQSNARFALSVDPQNTALRERSARIDALRKDGRPTVPSRLAEELATNPFLRAREIRPDLAEQDGGAAAFAALRAAKDVFR